MRFLLIFAVLVVSVIATAALVSAQTPPPSQTPADVGTPTGPTATPDPNATSGSTGSGVAFSERFNLFQVIKGLESSLPLNPMPSPVVGSACVPTNGFNAYGFYTLDLAAGKVDFSVYSRVFYYALTPGPLGNLTIPSNWKANRKALNITQNARLHGAKVDLVINNNSWNFQSAQGANSGESTVNGLRFTKSFVVLNMVDEIVDTVNEFGFDGVVIDFQLPNDRLTKETFRFFLKRLKDRLKAVPASSRANDLIVTGERLLSVMIDNNSNYEYNDRDNLTSSTSNSKGLDGGNKIKGIQYQVVAKTFDSVGLWIAAGKPIKDQVTSDIELLVSILGEESVPSTAALLPERATNTFSLNNVTTPTIVWDVARQNPDNGSTLAPGEKKWSPFLQTKIYGTGTNLKHTVSSNICTQRTNILAGLSVVTPLLVLLLVLSWVLYGFPYLIDRTKATLALWGLLVVAIVVFLVLVWSLPSVDFMHIGVYTIIGSLVVPVLYFIFTVLSQLTRPKYP